MLSCMMPPPFPSFALLLSNMHSSICTFEVPLTSTAPPLAFSASLLRKVHPLSSTTLDDSVNTAAAA